MSPRDLIANRDPIIENIIYKYLEDIAITNLTFDKAQYNIVFLDSNRIDYILYNNRNL